MRLKIYDIVFFILIGLIVFIALWLLFGSPTIAGALISITLFFATSELMIWRKIFDIDKNTAVGFMKVKSDLDHIKRDINELHTGQKGINNKLDNIERLIRSKR